MATYQAGRISLSDAMATRVLLASLEQYRSWFLKAGVWITNPACLQVGRAREAASRTRTKELYLVAKVEVERKREGGWAKICVHSRGREQRLERRGPASGSEWNMTQIGGIVPTYCVR
jgi:hypothetical protein